MVNRLLRRCYRRFFRKHSVLILVILGFFVLLGGLRSCSFGGYSNNTPVITTKPEQTSSTQNSGTTITEPATVPEQASDFEIHFIDVGQGDSTLIKCDNHYMLIDAGDNDKGKVVVDYLNSQNVTKLDYLIGTHPDSDHIGGLDTVIDNIECDNILLSSKVSQTKTFNDVLTAIENANNTYSVPNIGDTFYLGDAKVSVIGPVTEYEDNNNNSIAVIVEYSGKKIAFMGDTEKEGENDILQSGINIDVDVIKIGHHGSRSSSTNAFLSALSPEYAIISCGTDNSYGHPHLETLLTLRGMDVQIYRTDVQGTVIMYINNGNIIFNTSPSTNYKDGDGVEAVLYTGNYILNTKTKKFHYPTCEHVNDISDSNKETIAQNRDFLIEQGYTPCGSCKP